MQAIRVPSFGGPEVLKLEEVPTPVPGTGEVLIRVHAAGVNPVEAYVRAGTYPIKPPLPYTPGGDAAGVVEAVGEGTDAPAGTGLNPPLKVGDRVFTAGTLTGAYAQYTLAGPGQAHLLPSRLSFEQGAAIHVPYFTAYRALFHKARPRAGESLLVHGASGSVGLAAVELGRAFGLLVIGTASTDAGKKLVKERGAHHVVDHTAPDQYQEILRLTDGRGVDIILEMLANKNLNDDFAAAAKFGRVIVIGSRGTIEIDPRRTMGKDLTILGMTLNNVSEADKASIQAGLAAGFENGTLVPQIQERIPLAQAPLAHERVLAKGNAGSLGKIVLIA